MSPGDQLISVIIDSVGTFIGAVISSVFSAFVTPLLQIVASWFGLS